MKLGQSVALMIKYICRAKLSGYCGKCLSLLLTLKTLVTGCEQSSVILQFIRMIEDQKQNLVV